VAERYLIDTHCWLWWNADPQRLDPAAPEAYIPRRLKSNRIRIWFLVCWM
jgi:PIN domain nuclease of toxin-antitoxin system